MSDIGQIEFVFLLLLLFVIAFGILARKLGMPYPIVMVIGGLLLSFIPGIPSVNLHPDLIFLVVLPPLLYAAAWNTSWRDFKYNLVSIFSLAFGLVAFTVWGVAVAAPRVFSGFDWRLGFVLGAIVAPTDAIAATSIARRVGLPSRIVDILEGESLINDASGLLALQFATAILVRNQTPTAEEGALTFAWLIAGGIGIGLLVAWLIARLEERINDAPVEIALSILVPYAIYLAADRAHASGVLGVVACGLFLSRRSARFFSASVRLQAWAVWESLIFILNGLVFVLIGLQLHAIRTSIPEYTISQLMMNGAIFTAILILLRLAWAFPGGTISWLVRTRLLHQNERFPRLSYFFIIGWTGMRGVVSLAAALALPAMLDDGRPFPHRGLVVSLTFSAIFVTLVLQGLTLPPIIHALGLAGAEGPNCEEDEARRIIIETALEHLKESKEKDDEEFAELYEDLAQHYSQRLATLGESNGNTPALASHDRHIALSLETLRVERDTAIRLRNEGRINDEVLRRIERELDLSESKIAPLDRG